MRPCAKRRLRIELGFVLAVLFAFGCNGIGCQGCHGQAYPARDAAVNVTVPDGSVAVMGGFDQCPVVTLAVTPTNPRVDQPVMVKSSAVDADLDGGLLTFAWTATAGTFDAPAAHDTIYHCGAPGMVTVTLTVSDGVCHPQKAVTFFCVAMSDAGVNTGTGGSTGTGGGGGSTGGSGGGAVVNNCPSAEPTSGGAMCPQCTTDNCSLGMTGTDGCCGFLSPADQLLCAALSACIAANASTCTMSGDPNACFCGTAPTGGTCYAVMGAANGPCVNQFKAAAKTDDPVQIQARFISPNFPIGRAVNLAACRGAFCSAECGIN